MGVVILQVIASGVAGASTGRARLALVVEARQCRGRTLAGARATRQARGRAADVRTARGGRRSRAGARAVAVGGVGLSSTGATGCTATRFRARHRAGGLGSVAVPLARARSRAGRVARPRRATDVPACPRRAAVVAVFARPVASTVAANRVGAIGAQAFRAHTARLSRLLLAGAGGVTAAGSAATVGILGIRDRDAGAACAGAGLAGPAGRHRAAVTVDARAAAALARRRARTGGAWTQLLRACSGCASVARGAIRVGRAGWRLAAAAVRKTRRRSRARSGRTCRAGVAGAAGALGQHRGAEIARLRTAIGPGGRVAAVADPVAGAIGSARIGAGRTAAMGRRGLGGCHGKARARGGGRLSVQCGGACLAGCRAGVVAANAVGDDSG